MTLAVVTWDWNRKFAPIYIDRLRSMLARHLDLPHRLVCVTDRVEQLRRELAPGVRLLPMPTEHAESQRCRRRMWHFAAERVNDIGPRILACDLDVVITANITPLVDRPDPIVLWKVGYAGVYSGSFLLFNAGALDGAWRAYREDPVGYPMRTGERNASDQAMLNHWIKTSGTKVAHWTEADGLITWFGRGYERHEHHGMGPTRWNLRHGTRVVVLGSADKAVMEQGRYPFVREHWR